MSLIYDRHVNTQVWLANVLMIEYPAHMHGFLTTCANIVLLVKSHLCSGNAAVSPGGLRYRLMLGKRKTGASCNVSLPSCGHLQKHTEVNQSWCEQGALCHMQSLSSENSQLYEHTPSQWDWKYFHFESIFTLIAWFCSRKFVCTSVRPSRTCMLVGIWGDNTADIRWKAHSMSSKYWNKMLNANSWCWSDAGSGTLTHNPTVRSGCVQLLDMVDNKALAIQVPCSIYTSKEWHARCTYTMSVDS